MMPTEGPRGSISSRAAVWAVLSLHAPGADAFEITLLCGLTEAFTRATLHDLLMVGAIKRQKYPYTSGRNRRERTHYWRAVENLPSLARAQEMAGRKVRPCLGCREDFSSWGAGNRICDKCRGRDDPLPDVRLAGVRAGW